MNPYLVSARIPCAAIVLTLAGCASMDKSAYDRPVADSAVNIDSAKIAAAPDAPEPAIGAMTFFRAGRFHESVGRYDDAIAQYQNAIAADRNFAAAYDRKGIVFGQMGRNKDAEEALRRAAQIKPNDAAIRNNLGFQYILQRDWKKAETELRRALLLDATLDRAHINLAVALAAQERIDEALAEFRVVLPEPDALYNIGLAYRTLRRYDEARATFARVLELNPKFEAARRQLASFDALDRRSADATGVTDPDQSADAAGLSLQVSPLTVPTPMAFFEPDATAPAMPEATAPPVESGDDDHGLHGDFDRDGDVDLSDFAELQKCLSREESPLPAECVAGDFDHDDDVDLDDFNAFQAAHSDK